ncbi:MAG TPA: hypothetical protein DEP48_02915 [Persephonella sp.]|uniref:Uncharacterized protein n=1 Tax=Persephonella marina (strain DSM 14350 / EX-H1) TaxID=123214 RepID=C0QSA0_PERMH|nr:MULTISPECIES: hypothetical protein [Persephonella]ACO03841.1 hypothetical protein PERMA_1783 [Persephonella marina EX-H1]HCB69289.1 hypothetical protein [Persephonella sp.]
MIYKANFKLIIGDEEETQNLLEFKVFQSARFHTQHCQLKVSKIEAKLDDRVELYLGYKELYPVFKGYVTDISNKRIIFIKAKDEYIKLVNERITKSFNKTTPKEIINSIVKYEVAFTEKSFIQKHHFPIWNESIDTALRRVQKTWNLKNFIWFFDMDGVLHFHDINEDKFHKDYKAEITTDLIKLAIPKKDHMELYLTKPLFDIYPLHIVDILANKYLVETVIHTYEDKKLTTTLYLSNLS